MLYAFESPLSRSLALSLRNPRSAFRKLLNFFNQPCSDSTFQSRLTGHFFLLTKCPLHQRATID